MTRFLQGMAGLVLAGMISICGAVEPGWYGPQDGTGRGLLVHCQPDGVCGFVLFTSGNGSQIWYIGAEPCARGAECRTSLFRASTLGDGMAGTESAGLVALGPVAGEITIVPDQARVLLSWQVWPIEQCQTAPDVPAGTATLQLYGCARQDQAWPLIVGIAD